MISSQISLRPWVNSAGAALAARGKEEGGGFFKGVLHERITAMIYNNITKTVGNTPLVRINRMTHGIDATILAKIESFNPLSSVKDRIGVAMIEEGAEKQGLLNKDTVIVDHQR